MHWSLLTASFFNIVQFFQNDEPNPTVETTAPLIPRKALFTPSNYSAVTLSHDGKWLSWIAPIGTVPNIWVKRMPNGEARNLTHDTGRGISGASWLYDNKTLIYSQDADGDENWRLYTLDVETAKARLVTDLKGVRASVLASSVKYPDRLIINLNDRDPQYHDAYELNVTTGEKKLIFLNKHFIGYTFNNDMQIRLLFNMTDEGGMNYFKYENGTVSLWKIINFENSGFVYPLGFDNSGEKLYWMDNEGKDFSSFYELDWNTGEKTLIYEPKNVTISGVLFHPITKKPITLTENYAKPVQIFLDKTYENDFAILQELLPHNSEARVIDYSLDFNTWIVVPRTDIEPATYFYYNRSEEPKNITFMFHAKEELMKYSFSSMHPVQIPVSDNLTEICYLTLPLESDDLNVGVPNKPVPLVLNVHGGPWASDSWGFVVDAQYFANRGYAVLQCNFRGSVGYGKTFLNAGNGEWGKKMQQDLTDAVKWAIKRKIADPKKVAIYGGSYGGYAALAGLTFTPELYACGVDIVGPSNLVTLLHSIPPYWKPAFNQFTKRIGGHPDTPEGKAFLENVSPLFFAHKITKPLLIGQGANDPRVKRHESDQIVKALKDRKIPVTYVVFPNEGHGFARPENNMAFSALVEQFFKKCLGGRAEPIEDEFVQASIGLENVIN